MAGRPRKSQSAEVNSTNVPSGMNVEQLDAMGLLKQMQEEINSLKQQINEKNQQLVSNDRGLPEFETEDNFDAIQINPESYIKVMGLCEDGHQLNLSVEPKGRGRHYSFNRFGEVLRINYGDLNRILQNHRNFLEDGKFIVLDKRCIRKNSLDDIYSKILTKETIERIINGKGDDAVSLFKSAPEAQQEIMVRMIVSKLLAGVQLDLNMVDKISRAYDPKHSIESMVEEAREYEEILKS
jgi:hypothetical protein